MCSQSAKHPNKAIMKEVYQISDLVDRETLDQGTQKPARLAVLGYPVAHSASPAMHQAALDAEGMEMRYIRLEVLPGELKEAFNRMSELGFIGCNVTVPHKLEAMECCDTLSDEAKAIGVVNTVTFSPEGGKISGHNTDGPGLERAIREDFQAELSELRVAIVGVGGGAGKAIATQCARLGCPQLWLINRTVEKAQNLSNHLSQISKTKMLALANDAPNLEQALGQADLIINATSLGMKADDPLPVPATCLKTSHMVYDAIYKPSETALLKEAHSRQASTSNGFSMLLHQGVLAYEHWFPGQSPTDQMKQGLQTTL